MQTWVPWEWASLIHIDSPEWNLWWFIRTAFLAYQQYSQKPNRLIHATTDRASNLLVWTLKWRRDQNLGQWLHWEAIWILLNNYLAWLLLAIFRRNPISQHISILSERRRRISENRDTPDRRVRSSVVISPQTCTPAEKEFMYSVMTLYINTSTNSYIKTNPWHYVSDLYLAVFGEAWPW